MGVVLRASLGWSRGVGQAEDVIWGCREKAPGFTHIVGKLHSFCLCDIIVLLPSTKGHSFRMPSPSSWGHMESFCSKHLTSG